MSRALSNVRGKLFEARHLAPRGLRDWAKHDPRVRRVLMQQARWGNLRRDRPFSLWHGGDRGRPIDRIYIEDFLAVHAADIQGAVLEVEDRVYTERFGQERVTRSEVLDVVATNETATILADLCVAGALPRDTFDCVVLTQTLQFLADPRQALRNIFDALREGGVALITAPATSHRILPGLGDRWRFTPEGLETLLREALPETGVELVVAGRGNFLSNVGFLYGLAEEDLSREELMGDDADYPLVATARVVRQSGVHR